MRNMSLFYSKYLKSSHTKRDELLQSERQLLLFSPGVFEGERAPSCVNEQQLLPFSFSTAWVWVKEERCARGVRCVWVCVWRIHPQHINPEQAKRGQSDFLNYTLKNMDTDNEIPVLREGFLVKRVRTFHFYYYQKDQKCKFNWIRFFFFFQKIHQFKKFLSCIFRAT